VAYHSPKAYHFCLQATTNDLVPLDGRETKTTPVPSISKIVIGTDLRLVIIANVEKTKVVLRNLLPRNVAIRQHRITLITSDSQQFLATLR
jgi:hypothetical protein